MPMPRRILIKKRIFVEFVSYAQKKLIKFSKFFFQKLAFHQSLLYNKQA